MRWYFHDIYFRTFLRIQISSRRKDTHERQKCLTNDSEIQIKSKSINFLSIPRHTFRPSLLTKSGLKFNTLKIYIYILYRYLTWLLKNFIYIYHTLFVSILCNYMSFLSAQNYLQQIIVWWLKVKVSTILFVKTRGTWVLVWSLLQDDLRLIFIDVLQCRADTPSVFT